ncbi:SpoIIE family protein phosphatase [Streptomyces sp. DH24]|uniref:ATP-binding SpoIIE family protein phosphatase n=1 Tax=Streptomyces sp. DH24 TaxID=3040123 RepID=UPI00244191B1|nr:SpoIIE family protein phosphatase [Streptomyces sp. DH24]MDG9718410.1 SpoIIE family protein phosphatase [Streptomyces sp. DH24]
MGRAGRRRPPSSSMSAPADGRDGTESDGLSPARSEAWDQLIWLNEASASVGTTLDLQRTAKEFADFTVPRLADGCAVDLLESVLHGEEGARWTGSRPPVLRAMAVTQIDRLGDLEPDPVGEIATSDPTLVGMQCLMARKPVLISEIRPDEYERIAVTRSAAAQMRKAGVHSYMVIPLIARGLLLGLADFVRSGDRPPFTDTDLALAVQLASKAAVFVDNARLYGRERDHVVTLQRSLLPRTTPLTPGLDVSTCYAPSSDPGGVGGDWFDVVALPGGRTALVVGDVMSHGLPAAATMGRLRSVARTLMALDIAPERVLARLDLAARDLEEDQIATCLCVVHDPFDGSYTVVRAGHPPPLLVCADGTARYLDVPTGAPLGAGVIPYDPVRVPVEPGSRLVLFTDGLIKTRTDDVDTQLQRLLDAASGPRARDLDADGLIGTCPITAPRFDEAVMVVARSRSHEEGLDMGEWRLPDDGSAAGAARRLVRERLEHWRLTDLADVTELVVSELVGNALRYGSGPGHLRLLRHERLVVEVSDTGPDLPQIQHTTLSDEGGRGLQLINMLCRRWGSCRTPSGKVVWAEQDIPGTARPV